MRVTVACFLWPLCLTHTALGSHSLAPGGAGQTEEAGDVSPKWDIGTRGHFPSLSISSSGLFP